MITVQGLIAIYTEPVFKEVKGGVQAQFESATLVRKTESKRAYRFTSIYVPDKEVEFAKKKLIPGQLVQLEKAQWLAPDEPKSQREKAKGHMLTANWYDVILIPYSENRK